MSGGSGEPLSEELEAKIEKVKAELRGSYFTGGPGRYAEWWAKVCPEILRDFAREILTSAREVAPDRPNSLQPFDESAARSELLASQSREKALSEKLTSLESVDKQLTDARESLWRMEKERDALLFTSDKQAVAWKARALAAEESSEANLVAFEGQSDLLLVSQESARSLAEALESVQDTAEAAVEQCRMDIATLNKVDAIRHLAVIGLRAYREAGRGKI